jgi:predicted Rossmann fold nucleotide-binding protein DprA/Smf involved in DNA uptake
MKKLKKDLEELGKSLKRLAQKTEQITKNLDKLGKAQAPKKSRVRAEATKKVSPKKPKKMSAGETILDIIKRSEEGADTAHLKKKTGFKATNIRAVLFRLKKLGKIKSERKGVYEKT